MTVSATAFEFVLCDPESNPKPGTSLQVRSRCMQGKNKRENSRRTQRDKRRAARENCGFIASQQTQESAACHVSPPRSRISDLTLFRFDGTGIDSEAMGLLSKAYSYNTSNQAMTPLDRCVELECLESVSFGWLFSDTAFSHSVLCASYARNDFMSPRWDGNPGRKTVYHLHETLSLLRVKMQNRLVYQDESALHIIINLTLLAAVFGDWVAAAAHLEGLRKMVRLRGDMIFLSTRPTLHFKLDRIDLAWSLSSGREPFFIQPSISWDQIMSAPYSPLPRNLFQSPPDWDFRLVNVFRDLQYLSLRINRNRFKYARYNPALFQGDLTSVQSRLINLGNLLKDPVQKLVRLTMLAYMTTTFKIPGRKIPYDWVVDQLADTYQKVTSGLQNQDTSLILWVLITVTFTVAGAEKRWIKEAWNRAYSGLDWAAVKNHLMRVMWIEMVHDRAGELVYYQLEGL